MILRFDKSILLFVILLLLPILCPAQEQTHIVKRGDTLYSLGRRYNMTVQEIQELNGLKDTHLAIGQVLKVKASSSEQSESTSSVNDNRNTHSSTPLQRSSLPASHFYQIKKGDNLYRIAKKHQISLQDIVEWNEFLNANIPIYPGQLIIIKDPALATQSSPENKLAEISLDQTNPHNKTSDVAEKIYIVKPKDTLYRIALNNNTSVAELKELNSLTGNDLRVGQKLYLSGKPKTPDQAAIDRIEAEAVLTKDRIRDDLAEPVAGEVISEYGLRNGRPHKGIDLAAKSGTPVYAVLDGTVVYSGTQGAYGNVVVLEHQDFVMTVYAHNDKNSVTVGEKVQKGQQIATVGSTGNATCSHLHFEYRIKGKAIDPRKVLPFE